MQTNFHRDKSQLQHHLELAQSSSEPSIQVEEENTSHIDDESKLTILSRCIIHAFPTIISITIIAVNLRGIFLGADLNLLFNSQTASLVLLRFIAQVQALMIVISLCLIVVQFFKSELLVGRGLSSGLAGSGSGFTDLQFLLRRDFWDGARDLMWRGNVVRRIVCVLVLSVVFLTAVFTGPACDVLLVPKSQAWPAGGTSFFLNGTAEQLWPVDLSGDMSDMLRFCNGTDSISLGICPAGGFYSLQEHWSRFESTNFNSQQIRPFAKDLSGSRFYWPVSSPASQIPPLYSLGDSRQGAQPYTMLVQPHAAAIVMLQQIALDWWTAFLPQTDMPADQIDDRKISAEVMNALSAVRCSNPQNLSAADKEVRFPKIVGRFDFGDDIPLVIESSNSTASNHLRLNWVHLPEQYGAASIGAVFESPWSSNKTSRIVIGCTTQAGWVPSTVLSDEYTFWSGWYPWNINFGARSPSWVVSADIDPLHSTNGRIAIGDDWLRLLAPPAPSPNDQQSAWRPTTLESLIASTDLDYNPDSGTWSEEDFSGAGKTVLLEAIISNVMVDGLSRTESYRAFDTVGPIDTWSLATYAPRADFRTRILNNRTALQVPNADLASLTRFQVNMEITGFALERSPAGYLAVSMLAVHILMAFSHITCALLRGKVYRN